AVEARERSHRQQLSVHAKLRIALARGPFCEIGVQALAVHDERREEHYRLAAILAHQPRGDRLRALRLDRDVAVRAMLRAELDEKQAQEVVHLGERADRGLSPAAARALLD